MSQFEYMFSKLKEIAKKVDKFMIENVTGKVKELWEASRHYILAGGKRLRPFLVVKSYELKKKGIDKVIPVAAAVEVLHTFTLIHDDIMDKDALRRGVPTVHVKWGEALAILAGDLLFAMSFVLANKAPIPEDIKAKIAYELGKVCVDLAEGQTMDISFEKREDVTVEEYMEMIRLKTGALFRTSAKVGGLAAGADDNELSKLEEYGEKLGIAFQIADDILGLVGEKDKLGKPVGSDIREGKKTYLVLYAREHLDTNDAKRLMTILNKDKKSDMEINEAIELVKRSGALDQAKTLAQSIADDAIKALNIFPESDARKDLEILARLAVERTY